MTNRQTLLLGASVLALGATPVLAQGQQGQPGQTPQGAQIQVQQPQPQIQVQQPPPQVTVQQSPPQVTVQQPQPEVTVTQPKPEVTVQQAQPEVNVQQPGQPQVTVEQPGQPKVNVEQPGQPKVNVQTDGQTQNQPGQQRQGQQSQGSSSLIAMTPAQLKGKDVVNQQGTDIGNLDDVVKGKQDGKLYAVVSTGGVLGLGSKEVVVLLDELQMAQDRNTVMLPSVSQNELQNMTAYNSGDYQPIPNDQPLNGAR